MASIKLRSLVDQPTKSSKGYTYSDLHLDFAPVFGTGPFGAYTQNDELHRATSPEIIDIRADYDLGAIRNSLINLFTTIPGQKILNPYFGLNLVQYVFEACDEDMGNLIGNEIVNGVTTFEPRVVLKKVSVVALPDDQEYDITIAFSVPSLGTTSFQLIGTLSTSGFTFTS